LVSDSPDSDGAYTIVWNQPPTTPTSITVPATILSGVDVALAWGTSTDPEGALAGYKLERQLNAGTWTQIYSGAARTYTDTVAAGNTSVAYRVKAYDAVGAESAYQTSDTRTVTNNTPPAISGSDSSLGAKTGAFTQSYTITDTTGTITAVEKIDGAQKRSYAATSGAAQTFNVTADDWIKLSNGSHTLAITATDSYGAETTRTYTFTKSVTTIDARLTTPLVADAMPTKALLNVARQIPSGATFAAYICNNGNDASPTWEDCTNAVINGSKFFFTNTTKTASAWGVNVKITVNRGTATGSCYISSIGGNFE
jgi:hypothetical protein